DLREVVQTRGQYFFVALAASQLQSLIQDRFRGGIVELPAVYHRHADEPVNAIADQSNLGGLLFRLLKECERIIEIAELEVAPCHVSENPRRRTPRTGGKRKLQSGAV